jgi:Trk K+ transport system NAD-binding subunit
MAVVLATSDDLVNLEVALLVRDLHPTKRVVLRLSDPNLAQTLREAANVRLALSLPTLAAPAFVAALFGDRVQSIFLVSGRILAVVDLTIQAGSSIPEGGLVREVAVEHRLLPIALQGIDGRPKPSPLEQRLQNGDRLTAIVALPDLGGLLRRDAVPHQIAVPATELAPGTRGT